MSNSGPESIVSRVIRLNQLLLGKGNQSLPNRHLVHRDGLLDILFALYEECNTKHMKKDAHISTFVDKIQHLITELRSMRVSVGDFEVKKVIGRGNFGEVKVVREKASGDVYAMKILRKGETLAHQCVAFYEEERDIMAKSTSPWITKLQYAFQDTQHLYLVMEFHPGGDMLSLLEKYNCLSDDMARFYLAELVLAIHTVHSMGYAHRDIKPDNILIDRTGHIKLADFGSASKLNPEKIVISKMPVGTPDYIAPEVLVSINDIKPNKNKGYGTECDWWSFGIVAYEMLYGVTPFADEKVLVVYNNIMNFKNSLTFPEEISEPFKNLITNLLTEATERLTYDKLLNHIVFEEVDWNNIRQTVPPFVPTVTSQDDTSNFDDFEQDVRPSVGQLQLKKEFSGRNLPFVGFTYTTPLESGHERFPSHDGSLDSPSKLLTDGETLSKKKAVTDLQNKVATLSAENDSMKNEVKKFQNSLKKKEDMYESEICRLEDQITSLQADKKELMHLLQLEREDRVLTERKACQILKCMKRRKRKNFLTVPNSAPEKLEDKNSDAPLLEQLEDALSRLDESFEEKENVGRFVERAKSLSPRFPRQSAQNTRIEFKSVIKSPTQKALVERYEAVDESVKLANSLKQENSLLKNDLQEIETAKKEAQEQVEALKRVVFKIEGDLHKAEQECHRLSMESKNSKVTNAISDLENELSVKNNTITELQKQLLDSQDSLNSLKAKFQDKEKKLHLFSITNDNLEANLKAMQREHLDLHSQNEELQKVVDELTEKVQSLEEKSWVTIEESKPLKELSIHQEEKGVQVTSVYFDEENEKLIKRNGELEAEINALKSVSKQSEKMDVNFEKLLKEKEDALSEIKLDLRIATREKKRVEDIISSIRDSNRELREKLTHTEKLLEDKTNVEKELVIKIKDLEIQLNRNKGDINEKIKMFEIEKAKLEERVKAMQDVCESQKGMNEMYSKSQGHYEEIAKQNEKLKCEQNFKETERLRLQSEREEFKAKLLEKQQECTKHEKIISTLKKATSELEEELKEFEFLEKNHESELIKLKNENKQLREDIKKLQTQMDQGSRSCSAEKSAREELEQQIDELEEELENQQSVHEAEIQTLQDEISHQKKIITDLEAHITEMGKELSSYDHDSKIHSRKNITLEAELIQLKEESAKLITQIASLKSSNLKLTHSLEEALDNEKEALKIIDQLHDDFESSEAKYNHEKVKLHETISQQAKLIDFLQAKTESMEKKKKAISVPRFFGKKDNTLGYSTAWNESNGLEQERTKCRRLQDQLSQARAENMALRNELNQRGTKTPLSTKNAANIPISPISRAMHSALTFSPNSNGEPASPVILTQETATKIVKLQGMKHHIPHRFNEIMCMRGYKCSACLDSIHFGRPAAKCQECGAICHPKCATSLPSTCGLPSGFMQHFKSAFSKNPASKSLSSAVTSKVEGWIKVPKSNKQGWERRYIRIEESMLYLFNDSDIEDPSQASDSLDFASKDGEIIVISAVSATELANAAKSDLPYVMKVEYRPFTTCWPPRPLYLMADSFSDKQMWVETLEALVDKYKTSVENSGNKLVGEMILKLKGDKIIDILCTFLLDNDIMLLGAMEGLFFVPLSNNSCGIKSKVDGIESVYQITCVSDIGILVLISGQQRNLKIMPIDELHASLLEKTPLSLEKIDDTQGCHLFAVQETSSGGFPHLCAATANILTLFAWNINDRTFCKRKAVETPEPCSCIHFTQNSVIFGCDKFYEMDLKTCAIEEFLDCADSSLAGLVYGVSQLKSFPISIFHVAAVNQPEEYLVCFHELGVFVDGFGQRTRPEDMKWSRLPLAFAYRAPYLFVTHFNSLEVIEILPRGSNDRAAHGIMEIPNPQYLGPAVANGAIYISSSHDNYVEVLCVEGNKARQRNINHVCIERSPSESQSSTSKESEAEDGLDFSFSNSLIQSLDAPSCDNRSESLDETESS